MAKALYREYRPKTFDEVLGQDRVVNVLKNQVISDKISHAYLFSGERGTGKTSCAKILAKAVNCLHPVDGSPCLECENCRAIEDETTIDVVEMDAASNRRIDDIRNLKDNVIYPPNKLKYKVYIIDEAHMITREAFNALLKIMEEPPSHLIFILATTEIEKVPNTILSRVQKFEFNKIDENKIREQINKILADKNIDMEKEAVDLIIKKAGGAMRDGLSILDQVISLENTSYSLDEVETILGVVDFYQIDKLSQAIIGKNPAEAIEFIFSLREAGKSNKDILDSLTSYFKDIMIYKMTQSERYFDNEDRLKFIKQRADEITDVDVTSYLDILVDYTNRLKLTDNTDVLTELAILRLVNLKSIENIESRIKYLENNMGSDLIDTIHRIIDQRLANLDIDKLKTEPSPMTRAKPSELKNEPENLEQSKKLDPVIEEDGLDNKAISTDSEETNILPDQGPAKQARGGKLDPATEATIKEMLVTTAGGMVNGLFLEEGFNYDIADDNFIMYIDNEFYLILIETKIGDIENKLAEILGENYKFTIESLSKKNNNIIKKDEETPTAGPGLDNTARLREVFGDELIIE